MSDRCDEGEREGGKEGRVEVEYYRISALVKWLLTDMTTCGGNLFFFQQPRSFIVNG